MQRTILDRVEPVADDVLSLVPRGADGPLAPWEPGAHVDVALPNWLVRQYSLCGDPDDREHYRIAVRHDRLSRGGSEYVHLFLRPGREVPVSVPRNHFPLVDSPEHLFVAGGIGITPILPMFRAALRSGSDARLVHIGRTRESMPFSESLRRFGDRVRTVVTDVDGRPDLTELAEETGPRTQVHCCGPASMLDAAESAFPADRLHVERFRPVEREFAPNTAFTAHCARSGRAVQVPAGESLLDALEHAGHAIPTGCREGVCGSCELRVLAGEPEHRDDIGASGGRIYPCVSRAVSEQLVLDL